ncbi:hypothetical protein A1356_05660 [Methylomonas koyamae]|uniref:Uncharacterized protein n=1 Tax=Methylomonas koyamae TaxID=702114 RepID=A0AA91DGA7_9GAMM|nr:hypothetical protein AYM39_12975 [Methylomonas sp. DH-1]OAI29012.1 hypothetical protein A1356_05660 [Methylomonas koyamae]
MQAPIVVKIDDIVGHVADGLGVVGILAAPDTLHFQIEKDALHDRVVPAVTLATHAALKAVANQ